MSVRRNSDGKVTFVFDQKPDAKRVFLAGDFNDWSPESRRMVKVRDGTFRARMALPRGEYQYKFVVDGEWRHDDDAEAQAPNECGSLNSVVSV